MMRSFHRWFPASLGIGIFVISFSVFRGLGITLFSTSWGQFFSVFLIFWVRFCPMVSDTLITEFLLVRFHQPELCAHPTPKQQPQWSLPPLPALTASVSLLAVVSDPKRAKRKS